MSSGMSKRKLSIWTRLLVAVPPALLKPGKLIVLFRLMRQKKCLSSGHVKACTAQYLPRLGIL